MSTTPGADEVAGGSLYSERTHLAWQRTGLAFLGVGALLVHAAGGFQHPLSIIPGLFGMAVSAVIFGRGLFGNHAPSAARAGEGKKVEMAAPTELIALSLAAALLSVSGLIVIIASA